jgi:hypothetical protein
VWVLFWLDMLTFACGRVCACSSAELSGVPVSCAGAMWCCRHGAGTVAHHVVVIWQLGVGTCCCWVLAHACGARAPCASVNFASIFFQGRLYTLLVCVVVSGSGRFCVQSRVMRDTQCVGSGRVLGCDVWLAGSRLLRLGTFGLITCGWQRPVVNGLLSTGTFWWCWGYAGGRASGGQQYACSLLRAASVGALASRV